MSFRDDVLNTLKKMHMPVSSNDVYLQMRSTNAELKNLTVADGRAKVSQTLSDLRRKRNIIKSIHTNSGILVWDWNNETTILEQSAPVKPAPIESILVPIHKKSERAIVKDLLIDFADALRKAADAL